MVPATPAPGGRWRAVASPQAFYGSPLPLPAVLLPADLFPAAGRFFARLAMTHLPLKSPTQRSTRKTESQKTKTALEKKVPHGLP